MNQRIQLFHNSILLKRLFLATITVAMTWFITPLQGQNVDLNKSRLRTAQELERRGNYQAALRIYRNLYDLVPQNQLYYEGVKRTMVVLKLYDELVAIIQNQINMHGGREPRYWADLGNVFYKRGDQVRAADIWQTILFEYSAQKAAHIYVANAMIDNRLYDEAMDIYLKARKIFNDTQLFVFELANLYVLRLKYEQATNEYLNYLEKNSNQFNFVEGQIAKFTKEPDQAQEVAEVLKQRIAEGKQEYFLRKLLADLYLRVENFELALQEFKILETVEQPNPRQQPSLGKELYFFAEKSLRAGQYQFARDAFELILNNYPSSPYRPRALYGIAVSKQKQGLSADALTSYQELIARYPATRWVEDASFQIGEIYFEDLFDLDQALKAYHKLIRSFPDGNKAIDAHFRIGDCYAIKGDLEKAKLWYHRSANLANATSEDRDRALFKNAQLDFMQGEFDDALAKLQEITKKIAEGKANEPFVNDALELSFQIEENHDDSQEALGLYGLSKQQQMQRNPTAAIKSLQEILSSHASAAIVDESLFDLGELENQRGNYSAAIDYFQSILKDHPESLHNELAQKRIAEIYETKLGELQKAYEAYEQILVNYPNSVYLEEVRQKLRTLLPKRLSN